MGSAEQTIEDWPGVVRRPSENSALSSSVRERSRDTQRLSRAVLLFTLATHARRAGGVTDGRTESGGRTTAGALAPTLGIVAGAAVTVALVVSDVGAALERLEGRPPGLRGTSSWR